MTSVYLSQKYLFIFHLLTDIYKQRSNGYIHESHVVKEDITTFVMIKDFDPILDQNKETITESTQPVSIFAIITLNIIMAVSVTNGVTIVKLYNNDTHETQ